MEKTICCLCTVSRWVSVKKGSLVIAFCFMSILHLIPTSVVVLVSHIWRNKDIHLSIRPYIVFCLFGVGSWWQQAQLCTPDVLHPGSTLQLLMGDPEALPGQRRCIVPPAGSGSARGLLPVGCTQKTTKGRRPGGMQEIKRLVFFLKLPNYCFTLFIRHVKSDKGHYSSAVSSFSFLNGSGV